jgi:hypothetical protein
MSLMGTAGRRKPSVPKLTRPKAKSPGFQTHVSIEDTMPQVVERDIRDRPSDDEDGDHHVDHEGSFEGRASQAHPHGAHHAESEQVDVIAGHSPVPFEEPQFLQLLCKRPDLARITHV